jgi:hypothetical protein
MKVALLFCIAFCSTFMPSFKPKKIIGNFFLGFQYFMENFEQKWLETETMLRERFGKAPDMEGILFLIGVNELGGMPRKKFSKEQKQDLMHIAVCTLLCQLGYYEYSGRDEENWPHFHELETVPISGIKNQEHMLKECIIRYFNDEPLIINH